MTDAVLPETQIAIQDYLFRSAGKLLTVLFRRLLNGELFRSGLTPAARGRLRGRYLSRLLNCLKGPDPRGTINIAPPNKVIDSTD